MKKLFTLAAILLTSFSMIAASYVPLGVLDVTKDTVIYSNVSITEAGAPATSWVVVPQFGASSMKYTNTNGDSNGNPTNIVDNIPTISTSVNFVQIKTDGNTYTAEKRVVIMHVKGIVGLIGHGATSSSGRGMAIGCDVFDEDNIVTAPTQVASVSRSGNSGSFIVQHTGLDASKEYIISFYATNGDSRFYAVEFFVPDCDDPNATIIADASGFVGDEIDLEFSSDNTSYLEWDVTLDGEPAVGDQDYSWAADGVFKPQKPGTFVVTAEQEADGTHCAVAESVTLTIAESNPVTACAISGVTSALIGQEVTFTATAAGATVFQWWVNDVKQDGEFESTFKFTPTAAGTFNIVAKARNGFNAADEWIASDPIALIAKPNPVIVLWNKTEANRIGVINYGSSKVTTSTVKIHINTDAIDGIKLESSYSYADKHFVSIKPASGYFEPGDTVYVATCFNNNDDTKTAKVDIFGEDGATKLYTSAANGINGRSAAGDPVVEKYVLTSVQDSLLIGRNGNTATFITTLRVVRPEDDGTPVLTASADEITLAVTSTETNPTAQVSIYGKNLTPGTYNFGGTSVLGLTITPSSVTVGDDGKLKAVVTFGYENENDANPFVIAKSLTIDHASGTKVIQVSLNLSAEHAKDYATSLNIEQWVLDNGMDNTAFAAAVAAANIEFSASNGLDSLNDTKASRNEPYLGLKLKAKDITIKFWLEKGKALNVKFGNQTKAVAISINDVAQEALAAGKDTLVLAADADNDRLIELKTTDAATLVVKQIMIGEALKKVELPEQVQFKVTCVAGEHGTVKIGDKTEVWIDKYANIVLNITPAEGYAIGLVKYEGTNTGSITISPDEGVYQFTMPEEEVTVSVAFEVAIASVSLDVVFPLVGTEIENKIYGPTDNVAIITVPEGANYELSMYDFWEEGGNVELEGALVENTTYEIRITVEAKAGFAFASNAPILVNGVAAEHIVNDAEFDRRDFTVSFQPRAIEEITEVAITIPSFPKLNETVGTNSFEASVPDDAGYTINNRSFFDEENNYLNHDNYVFTAGTYVVELGIFPKTGFAFPKTSTDCADGTKITMTVNGEDPYGWYGAWAVVPVLFVRAQFTVSDPTGMGNTEVEGKTVKMIENGQVIIIKNGVRYNALGEMIK